MKNNILILKASGVHEFFDVSKLKNSLLRSGASNQTADFIAFDVQEWLYEGVTTKQIYERAFKLLKSKNSFNAVRYKLKKALFDMGPSGHPFESFIGEIFKGMGYNVEVAKTIQGHCISHEMDVIATNAEEQLLIECKYAQDQGKHVSIQVPLYVRARVDDIVKKRIENEGFKNLVFKGGIVTNTRFTSDSIAYAKCSGLFLMGWDYPAGRMLKDIMEKERIFPITILNNLTKTQINILLNKQVVTCKQLNDNIKMLDGLGLNKAKTDGIVSELRDILS